MINESVYNRKNYKYIYSVEFANYLMLQGVFCKGTGISKETGNYFWCFDKDECQPVYDKITFKKKHMEELKRQWAITEEEESQTYDDNYVDDLAPDQKQIDKEIKDFPCVW